MLSLKTQRLARIFVRGRGPTRAADAGGCGPACLHARITAAMSCLSAPRNAIFVCVNGGRRHREKRKCEQCRSGSGELFEVGFILFFSLFLCRSG
jgi:hypothetical protein